MKTHTLPLLKGARKAEGIAVIIDVFRAFSVAPYAFENGARRIIPVDDTDTAYALKKSHPEYLLMGERGGRKLPGFDFGNSPTEIEHADFRGKTLIHATSAGTRGLVHAAGAETVVTGSFVNADAVVRYLKRRNPEVVTLVPMGSGGADPSEEDDLCAEYLKSALEGESPPDFATIYKRLRACPAAQKFFDPSAEWAPERDFDLCLDLNRFDFVLCARQVPDRPMVLTRVEVPRT